MPTDDSPSPAAATATPLFVSYARRDAVDLAGRLATDLQDRGHHVWVDLQSIEGGGLFDARIEEAIRTASVVLAVLTPAAVREESICRDEIVFALNEGKSILPLLAHAAVKPTLLLARRHWIDLTGGYERGLDLLLRYLTGDASGLRAPALATVAGVAPLDFGPEVARFSADFTGREWLESQVKAWRESGRGRALVIVGEPGIGKSAIAARLTLTNADVVGAHFCTHRSSRSLDPHEFVASLVAQLHARLTGYAERVEARQPHLRRTRAADAFRELVVEPLRDLHHPPRLIVIDALDEAAGHVGETIVDVLAEQAPDLPGWLRILATTRPEARILDRVRVLDLFTIDAAGPENREDLERYTRRRLSGRPGAGGVPADDGAARIAALAAGNFLFARLTLDAIDAGTLTTDDLGRLSPGLAEFYAYAFRRRFPDAEVYGRTFGPLLGALAVACGPLSFAALERVCGEDAEVLHRRLRDLRSYIRISGPRDDPSYSLFHKSLQDWLTSADAAGEYWCPAAKAHRRVGDALAEHWADDLYALRHLPAHLTASREWERLADVLCNLAYVEAKCAAGMTFDLVADYRAALEATSAERQWARRRALEDFARFLQVQAHLLAARPALTLQQAANQPDATAVASAAPALIEGRRWLKWVNKPKAPDPIVMILAGHSRLVCACAYSPDGRQILSASADGSLRLWDAETGAPQATLVGHTASVLGCCFSTDGRRIFSAGGDQTIRAWDAATGQAVGTILGHEEAVLACAVSPDGGLLASASFDRSVKTWDARTGKLQRTLWGHAAEVCACAYSPDGRWLASGSHDHTLKIWDAETGALRLTLEGHGRRVTGCAFSPDSRRVVSSSYDATLKVWDVETGRLLLALTGHGWAVTSCAWSRDGRHILSASADKTFRLWDAETGAPLASLHGHSESVLSCAYSPDGRRIVGASVDRTLIVWDAEKSLGAAERPLAHARAVTSCGFSPDGQRVVSGAQDHNLGLWNARSGECLALVTAHADRVHGCAWSPDGARIVSASWSRTLKVWDAERMEALFRLRGHANVVTGCAYSPDGGRFVSASWDRRLRVWDASDNSEIGSLAGHAEAVNACAFSPDGRRIASGSYDRTLKLWDAHTGAEVATLSGHAGILTGCAFSPDGRFLASVSEDATIRIWDLHAGQVVRSLAGHDEGVWAVAYSLDATYLVSGSEDKTLRVWRAATGEEVLVLATGASVRAVAVGPGTIICGDALGRVLFLRAIGLETAPPVVTATFLYRPAAGRWDDEASVRCGWCGGSFAAPPSALEAAAALAVAAGTPDGGSPCLDLPLTAWDDPRLRSDCALCKQPLRFNPYVVDGRRRD